MGNQKEIMNNKEKIKKGIYFKFYQEDLVRLIYLSKKTNKNKSEVIRTLLKKEFQKLNKKN